jgi:hypothetical protein
MLARTLTSLERLLVVAPDWPEEALEEVPAEVLEEVPDEVPEEGPAEGPELLVVPWPCAAGDCEVPCD